MLMHAALGCRMLTYGGHYMLFAVLYGVWSSVRTGELGAVIKGRPDQHRGATEYSANPAQPRRVYGARSRGESNVSSFRACMGGGGERTHCLLAVLI